MPARGHRKPADRRRSRVAKTLLTQDEAERFEALVEASNLRTEAEVLRRLITGAPVPAKRSPERAELLRTLAGIGNNLNQLARQANAGGRVAEVDLQRAIDEFRAVARYLTVGR